MVIRYYNSTVVLVESAIHFKVKTVVFIGLLVDMLIIRGLGRNISRGGGRVLNVIFQICPSYASDYIHSETFRTISMVFLFVYGHCTNYYANMEINVTILL